MLIVIARDKPRQRRHARPQDRPAPRSRSSPGTTPPHPGYGARMRRLLIALAVLGSLGSVRGAGVGRARARAAGRRVPELGRSPGLAADARPAARRDPLQRRLVERGAHAARHRASDPGDPAYDWAATDNIVLNASQPGARASCSRSCRRRPGPTAAACRASRRSTRATSGRSAGPSRRATRAASSRPARLRRCRASKSFTVWNEPNRGQFFQPQGAHGFEAPRVMARSDALLRRRDPRRFARRAGRARPARQPRRARRHRADRVPRALPRRGRSAARRRGAQPVPREPAARVSRRREASRTARSPSATSTGSRTRSPPPTATRVPIWLTEFAWRTAPRPGRRRSRRSGRPSSPSSRSTSCARTIRTRRCSSGSCCATSRRRATGAAAWSIRTTDKKPVFATWARLARVSDGETLPSRVMLALWIVIAVVVLILL